MPILRRFSCGLYVECENFDAFVMDDFGGLIPVDYQGAAIAFGDRWDTEPYLQPAE